MCEELDTPCVIDVTRDMRRRTALQRTIEESKALQDTLSGVIRVIRSGGEFEIKDMIRHIQQVTEESALETLQTKIKESRESDNLTLNSQIKEENQEDLDFRSDNEEGAELLDPSLVTGSGLPRGRPASMLKQENDVPGMPSDFVQSKDARSQESESLASMYLPLIMKLRTVSNLEATRILHDFRKLPISVEGVTALDLPESVIALNLPDRQKSRPHLNIQTGQYLRHITTDDSETLNRASWHPSLQLTKPDIQTTVAGFSSWVHRADQWSGREMSQVCLDAPAEPDTLRYSVSSYRIAKPWTCLALTTSISISIEAISSIQLWTIHA